MRRLATILLMIFLAGGPSVASLAAQAPDSSGAPSSNPVVFARTTDDVWQRVLQQSPTGVMLAATPYSFEQLWAGDLSEPIAGKGEWTAWDELLLPLPDPNVLVRGYALTYPEHRKEARLDETFHFAKNSRAVRMDDPIAGSAYLDYELEIGVLFDRRNPERFGFVLINDLTDRGVQVRKHDPENPASSFSEAKSFEGALRIGPLLAVGDMSSWSGLRATLKINGEMRQRLSTTHCLLDPEVIHDDLFGGEEAPRWVLAATGTSEGVIFQSPSLWQKLGVLIVNGFSMPRAKESWLGRFSFLAPGDQVEIESAVLGRSRSLVTEFPS